MSGAWELPPQVLVSILQVDVVTTAWAFGLRNLIVPGHLPPLPLAGMPFDHARNRACQSALEMGADYLFFLDSDVIPPRDAILRLINHRKPLISGMYSRRSPPWSVPVMIRNGAWVNEFPKGSVVEVDYVGAGCMLIARSVLEQLPPSDPMRGKHWFDWKVDMIGLVPNGEALSEDFVFCKRVKDVLGIPTLVDTSIECEHVGYAAATHGHYRPMECRSVT